MTLAGPAYPDLRSWMELAYPADPPQGQLFRLPWAAPWLHAVLPSLPGRNHASQLCWAPDGSLLCVWMGGDGEGTAGMNVVLSRLVDPAGPWSQPVRISSDDTRSEQNPLLWVDHAGTLHLVHTAQEVRAPGATHPPGVAFSMQWTARLRHRCSGDAGRSWSATEDLLPTPCFCRHPPLALQDGSHLLPIYRSLEEGNLFGHDQSELLHLLPDGSPGELVPVPRSTGRVHGSLVRAAAGDRLLQFFRSRLADRVYRSNSHDGLSGWSEPQATLLPNNNSSIQALRLASGLLAIVFNRFGSNAEGPQHWGDALWPRTRWPLTVALSSDDGDTWPWIRDVDPGLGFCGTANWHDNGRLGYPSILEGPAGVLHITYSWLNQSAIRYLRLLEEDILGPSADWTA